MVNIPMVYGLERGIFEIIKTGDLVEIDANEVRLVGS